jgi:ERCC4-type nuclease
MEAGILYIDTAVGSKELEPILRRRGVKCSLYPRLPADFACVGRGKAGADWKIGVERKTLGDLGSSLVMNRLFGTQLPRMLDEYDRIWLLIEGIFRPGDDDAIEVWRGGTWVASRVPLTWSALQGWLLTYDEAVGGRGRRWRTSSDGETAAWLGTLLRWWNKKYDQHAGHVAIELNMQMPDKIHAMIHKPNRVQKAAFAYDKIGAKTALKVGRYFRSVAEMTDATEGEWRKAGLGKKDAAFVWRWLRERI